MSADNDTVLGKIIRILVTIPPAGLGILVDLLVKLQSEDCPVILAELKKFLRKEPCWTNGQVTQVAEPKSAPSILEPVSTIVVNATTGKFFARDRFVVNTERNGKVLISEIGSNFKLWFLKGDGKIEDPIAELTLHYAKLREASQDGPVVKGLGGEAKAETTLSEMSSLMEKQKYGEGGVLLNNGDANIFHIRDQNGMLRAVHVFLDGVGWYVDAVSVEYPLEWSDGFLVFSRNSVLEPSETSA